MADETKQQNPLSKFDAQLQQAKSAKELFSMPDVKERYIKNFEAVTGRKDGANRLEQERYAYMEILNDKPELKSAPVWSHFSALLKSATTGLSFRDGKLYTQAIQAVKDGPIIGIKVDPSPAGRREMMEMMPSIKEVPEAQVVYKGDIFIVDKLNQRIVKHESTEKSVTEDKLENIMYSYQRVVYKDGTIKDVVVPHDDLVRAKAKSKVKTEGAGVWLFAAEASKKTATKRAFRLYHKYPDGVVVYDNDEKDETEDTGYSEVVDQQVVTTDPPFNPAVNEETGEVYEKTEEVKKEPKKGKPKPSEDAFV